MSVRLLHEPRPGTCAAPPTFDTVLNQLATAQSTVEIFMYVWRSDDIGNRVGQAVLDAAERGVKVTIIKDIGAFIFERIEMNRKSFFNKPICLAKRIAYRLIRPSFPETYVEDAHTFELGQRILEHPNVDVRWTNETHTKYYLYDNRVLITGSINIEDRHFGYNDYMVIVEDESLVQRFRQRSSGNVPADPSRQVEFLCNALPSDGRGSRFEIKAAILELIDQAESSIYVEMAYLGDEDVTDALIAAAKRGIGVIFLFSREANIGNDLNYRTIHEIFTKAAVDVYLTDTMIHSKLMLFDDRIAVFGSANLSVFSLQKSAELDLLVRDHPELLATLRDVIARRIDAGEKVASANQLATYNRPLAALQQLNQKWNPN